MTETIGGLDEGVKLLELAKRAHILFKKQEPRDKAAPA